MVRPKKIDHIVEPALSCLTKRVIATTKLSIFEIVLSASSTPSEGYEKPNKAQSAVFAEVGLL